MPTIGDNHPAGLGRRGPLPVRPALIAARDVAGGRGGSGSSRRGCSPTPALLPCLPVISRAGEGEAAVRRGSLRVCATFLAAGVACGLTALAATHAGAQTPPPTEEADGLVHASLVLEGQQIDVAFPPDLAANEPAYAELLAGVPVRLGTFEGHRALRIGTLEADLEALAAERAAAGGAGGGGGAAAGRSRAGGAGRGRIRGRVR